MPLVQLIIVKLINVLSEKKSLRFQFAVFTMFSKTQICIQNDLLVIKGLHDSGRKKLHLFLSHFQSRDEHT